MATLFDSLQKKLNEPTLVTPAPQQAGVAAALRAKSGKATTSTGPAASNLGEQAAVQTAQTQLGQVQQAGALQGAALGQQAQAQQQKIETAQSDMASQRQNALASLATQDQVASETRAASQTEALDKIGFDETQKTQMINVQADKVLRELASERDISVDNIFREFQRSEKELAFREDAAQLEQMGFVLAMRDQSYLDELNRVAAERDLQDKLNYKDEMTRLVLGDEFDRMLDEMDFKRGINASQREWDTYISSIGAEAAIAMSNAAIADDARNQMISGVGNMAKTGIDAYYKYDKATPETSAPSGDYTRSPNSPSVASTTESPEFRFNPGAPNSTSSTPGSGV